VYTIQVNYLHLFPVYIFQKTFFAFLRYFEGRTPVWKIGARFPQIGGGIWGAPCPCSIRYINHNYLFAVFLLPCSVLLQLLPSDTIPRHWFRVSGSDGRSCRTIIKASIKKRPQGLCGQNLYI
jgi:hypothetical protein